MLKAVKHVLHVFTHNSLYMAIAVTVAAVYSLSLLILVYITGLFFARIAGIFYYKQFKYVLILVLIITVLL